MSGLIADLLDAGAVYVVQDLFDLAIAQVDHDDAIGLPGASQLDLHVVCAGETRFDREPVDSLGRDPHRLQYPMIAIHRRRGEDVAVALEVGYMPPPRVLDAVVGWRGLLLWAGGGVETCHKSDGDDR